MFSLFFPRTLSKVCLLGSCLTILVLGSARPAHAGYWEFDHLEENSYYKSQHVFIQSNNNGGFTFTTQTHTEKLQWTNQGLKYYINGIEFFTPNEALTIGFTLERNYGNPNDPSWTGIPHTGTGIPAIQGQGWRNVRAVMHWKRGTIQDANGQEVDNPNDNPPKYAWIYEYGLMSGSESTRTPQWYDTATGTPHYYNAQNPFAGSEFVYSNLSHPFHVPFASPTSWANWLGGDINLERSYATCIPASGDYAYGPTRRFYSQIDLPASVPGNDMGHGISAFVDFYYDAAPARLNILSRLKVDHSPSDLYTDYASSASIAAGHITSDKHTDEADLALQIQQVDNQGNISNVQNSYLKGLPNVSVDNKPGVDEHRHFSILPSDAPALGYTDGNGRVALALTRSRDVLTDANDQVVVRTNATGSSANIGHVWANIEWRMGENGEKEWSSTFSVFDQDSEDANQNNFSDIDDEDSPIWVWTRVKTVNDKPLLGHNMRFKACRVVVEEQDETSHSMVTKIFTTDSQESGQNVTYSHDIDSMVSKYLIIPSAISSGEGVYKGKLIVKGDSDFIVNEFSLSLEDQDSYHKEN